MSTFGSDFLCVVREFAGRLKARRNAVRAVRLLDSLPDHMRRDIGWPDRLPELHSASREFAGPAARRASIPADPANAATIGGNRKVVPFRGSHGQLSQAIPAARKSPVGS